MRMKIILYSFVALLLCGHGSAGPAITTVETGTCWVMGDPHYRTFDGHYYNFMGNCTYIMAKNCYVDSSHPAFEVQAENRNQAGSQMSSVGRVIIKVYEFSISIVHGETGLVLIDDVIWNLPITLRNGQVRVFLSGLSAVMETDFGLWVQYDWEQYLVVKVPDSYMGKVCGMCGNFNSKESDDFTMPTGSLAANVATLGKSWRVPGLQNDAQCSDECTGQCQHCESSLAKRLEADIFCGVLYLADMPFRECHDAIDPTIYYENCKYDYCQGKGKKYLCQIIQVYTDACQRAGVKIHDWRRIAGCPNPQCPENSHFESCGNACPATCEDPNAPSKCQSSCVEACTCDEGYVLSGYSCVPMSQCGCQYNGRYIEAGKSFYADDNCTLQYTCSLTGGILQIKETSCALGEQCLVIDGIRGCYEMSYAECMVSGDLHYLTFDGEKYMFQGTCVYQMAGVCSNDTDLVPFQVFVQNYGQDKKMGSTVNLIEFNVYGYSIVVSKENQGMIMVNKELTNLPVTLNGGKVEIYRGGFFAVIQTDFGVKVSYDWNTVALVTVPDTYTGAMCGLCGNYNHKPGDDLQMKDGKQAQSAEELGQSWLVEEIPGCVSGCKGPCPNCNITQISQYETNQYCGLLQDKSGPFHDCFPVVDPSSFFKDCLYDVCLNQGMKNMQCEILTAYTAACQEKGATVYPWRSATFCDISCPANSQYEICVNSCPATCKNLTIPAGCAAKCMEGCTCNDGFLLSGDQCVPSEDCGCVYKDRYYKSGQVFYPDGQCEEECFCNGTVECKDFSCGTSEKCMVKNGVPSCQPTGYGVCTISGDPHYKTFDNMTYDFQGTCTYAAAQTCNLEETQLIPFTVVVENEKWYALSRDPKVSVAKLVAVEVYGMIFILHRNQIGTVMVNGIKTNLPLSMDKRKVQVYQEGIHDVIITDFGLRVTYDLVYHVTVTIPSNYQGKTCGLCGNFDGNMMNEFQLPDGKITRDVSSFGAAWLVSVPGVICEDGCSGEVCPQCDEKKKTVLESACSIITNPEGPFATCHNVIDPDTYFNNCVFDACAMETDPNFTVFAGNQNMLCNSITAYVTDCQDLGIAVQSWRTPTFCPLSCPGNSHYQICAETCTTPCPGLTDIMTCPLTCAEGCACNSGNYFNGTGCVPLDQCSCYVDGQTVKVGETVVSRNCSTVFTCQKSGVILSQPMQCQSDEICQVKNGVQGCYPTQCTVESEGFLKTFSGINGAIGTAGVYDVVKVCNDTLVEGWFRVAVKLQGTGEPGLNKIVALYVFLEDLAIAVNRMHEIWVNGKKIILPSLLKNEVSVQRSNKTVVIEKKSCFNLSYTFLHEITVTVNNKMAGQVCGACGKLTFNCIEDFVQVKATASFQGYMDSWRATDIQSGV